LRGERPDPFDDLRTFVERYWPEPMRLAGRAGQPDDSPHPAAILITNPAPVSRYLAGLDLRIDGIAIDPDGMTLVNPTVGEVGVPLPVDTLGRERGFYVRRLQTAELRLPVAVQPGQHAIELRLSLAGVTDATFAETVTFAG
jgi:hypothetical protein